VAKEATHNHFHKLAILGTRYLMEGPVYSQALNASGIGHRTPRPEQRVKINQIIFDELVNGQFRPESLAYFVSVIESLQREGCDAVVLGCTEIPLLVTAESSPLPILDSTRLLARAALRKAVEG
jgi:aspartate racemase